MRFLVPRLKPNYDLSDWLSILNVFNRNKNVELYEREFSHTFEREFGTMFSHGRTGIYALLKVWGLNQSEIICPAYTCVVVPNAIVLSDNIPVFVDCESDSFNMSLKGIEDAITSKTRVIIATHLFGYPMNVIEVDRIAREASEKYGHKVYVIQDCAHSYGAYWNGDLVTKYGDAAIFGSNVSKIINSIFGGMVITNSVELDSALKKWRINFCQDAGISKSFKRFIYFSCVNVAFLSPIYSIVNLMERKGFLDYFVRYYKDGEISFPSDWNFLPCNTEARVGLSQLKKYRTIIDKRVKRAKNIINQVSKDSDISFKCDEIGATYSHLVAVVDDREKYVEKYFSKNIQLGILIEYSVPEMTSFKKYKTVETPNSDFYARHTINFPLTKDIDI